MRSGNEAFLAFEESPCYDLKSLVRIGPMSSYNNNLRYRTLLLCEGNSLARRLDSLSCILYVGLAGQRPSLTN